MREHSRPPGSAANGQAAAGAGDWKGLWAGAAKVDVTTSVVQARRRPAVPAGGRLHVRTLVLRSDATEVVLVTVDAVAIGEIGPIGNDYLPNVRSRLQAEFGIPPTHVLMAASHCHGIVCDDIEERTLGAVRNARRSLVPVCVGTGVGHEDRISENRRLRLKSGKEADVRRAYSLPPDDEIVGVGPIDPQIGVVRLDRLDGSPLAVVFTFACHPIQGVPGDDATADIAGFAAEAIESALGHGAIALYLQGCAGDVNPALYKNVHAPRNAEMLGSLLGLSTLQSLSGMGSRCDGRLGLVSEVLHLPAANPAPHIEALRTEQEHLQRSLKGTSLNLKTFLQLMAKHSLSPDYPSYYSYRYLHEASAGREDLTDHDAQNRRDIDAYIGNVLAMEQMTRLQANLELLEKHHAQIAGRATIDAEVTGLRIGDCVLVTFPGELSVQIGLNVKAASPHRLTFVCGCANGYIYYTPTAEQLANVGGAQEDSDCLLAPEWQALFEAKVAEMLRLL